MKKVSIPSKCITFKTSKKYSFHGRSEQKFIDSFRNWVAKYPRALQIIEDKGFCDLIREINPRICDVSRRTILRRLNQKEIEIDSTIMETLENVYIVACTTDFWTDD